MNTFFNPLHLDNFIGKAYRGTSRDQYANKIDYDLDSPTFLTFAVEFDFNKGAYNNIDEQTGLYMSPFLSTSFSNNSIVGNYLKSKKLNVLAKNYEYFIVELDRLVNETPWYIQSISGLEKLWQNSIDMTNNYKGHDTTLTFETLESLDLRITRLADLYRSVVYDKTYMREIIPENLRYFRMLIHIGEFRNLKHFNLDINYFSKYFNYMCFDCRMCEFDFSNNSFLNKLDTNPSTQAANTFSIKVNQYFEKHELYKGILLKNNNVFYKAVHDAHDRLSYNKDTEGRDTSILQSDTNMRNVIDRLYWDPILNTINKNHDNSNIDKYIPESTLTESNDNNNLTKYIPESTLTPGGIGIRGLIDMSLQAWDEGKALYNDLKDRDFNKDIKAATNTASLARKFGL